MTTINLAAEALFAQDLRRLEELVDSGVITSLQEGRIAVRVAEKRSAHLGVLKAQVSLDLAARLSDV